MLHCNTDWFITNFIICVNLCTSLKLLILAHAHEETRFRLRLWWWIFAKKHGFVRDCSLNCLIFALIKYMHQSFKFKKWKQNKNIHQIKVNFGFSLIKYLHHQSFKFNKWTRNNFFFKYTKLRWIFWFSLHSSNGEKNTKYQGGHRWRACEQ